MTNPKGIRISVSESDPIQFWFDLTPDAVDCGQYRVSQEEWDRLKRHQAEAKEIQRLLREISNREEVEFEEAWEEEENRRKEQGNNQDGNGDQNQTLDG